MLAMMNEVTDKTGWESKVFDETIVAKWKSEFLAMESRDISEKMIDEVIHQVTFQLRNAC